MTEYRDEATGVMREDGRGGGAFAEVTLRPHVRVADESMLDAAREAHRTAHEWCFIANSVNFPVHHDATVEVASERGWSSAALVRKRLLDLLDGCLRRRLVVHAGELLSAQRVDGGHDLVGGEAASSATRSRDRAWTRRSGCRSAP